MAAIACPHCGGQMYEKLATCPHCGGPVMTEALAKDIREYTDAKLTEVNQTTMTWLKISFVVGFLAMLAIISMTEGQPIYLIILSAVWIFYGFSSLIYGWYRLHPFRRLGIALFIPLVAAVVMYAATMAGIFYYMPHAISSLTKKKPLLTETEVKTLLEKGLID